MSEDQGNESSDESDDSDDEHGRRRRFKMERQGSIKLSTHKSGTDIPDTLGQCVCSRIKQTVLFLLENILRIWRNHKFRLLFGTFCL